MAIYVGCAGWNIRKEHASHFALAGTHLQRYASRFNSVEINSSFYRSHRRTTYERWASSTPKEFRFLVKLPKQITHTKLLVEVTEQIEQFATEASGLGQKLGGVLVQLPPSLQFDAVVVDSFFTQINLRLEVPIFCEPRHATWFKQDAEKLLKKYRVSRIAADPTVVEAGGRPGASLTHCYYRWHGSPKVYYSSYSDSQIQDLAAKLKARSLNSSTVWCIFDNTAEGHATENALLLKSFLGLQLV